MPSDATTANHAPDELSATLASLMSAPATPQAWADRGLGLARMLVQSQADWLEKLANTDDLTLLRNANSADRGHKALFGFHGLFPSQYSDNGQPAREAALAYLKVDRATRQAQLLDAVTSLRQLSFTLSNVSAAYQLQSILEKLPPYWFGCHPDLKD